MKNVSSCGQLWMVKDGFVLHVSKSDSSQNIVAIVSTGYSMNDLSWRIIDAKFVLVVSEPLPQTDRFERLGFASDLVYLLVEGGGLFTESVSDLREYYDLIS